MRPHQSAFDIVRAPEIAIEVFRFAAVLDVSRPWGSASIALLEMSAAPHRRGLSSVNDCWSRVGEVRVEVSAHDPAEMRMDFATARHAKGTTADLTYSGTTFMR
jgi:hypothetical protein